METLKNDQKIILSCNKQGIVEHIFLDSASLLEKIKLPVGLHSIVSPTSIAQLGSFWLSILEKSMEENVVLALRYNDTQINFIFSGYLLKDKVLLCGNSEMTSTKKALEEIMLINNEQANQIRLTEKKVGTILESVRNMEMSEDFLNDFSSLNNELINNKRELMRKNQKIELLNEELKVVNNNLRMFTRSVSHDLREPVRMVKSFLSLLNKKYVGKLDKKGQTYLNMASDGANRLSQMLEDLLEYHQSFKIGITETVDLNEVLKEVKQMLQKQIELKNAKVNSEKLPILKGSIAGFRQVFQNLVSNAIKFVPEGKVPVVSIQVEEDASNFTFKVSDNGIGIPENHKQEVFNLFKRLNTAQQFEGTGMGLAMVRKSIERMGGDIWIESTPGEGSSFYLTIPKIEKNHKL